MGNEYKAKGNFELAEGGKKKSVKAGQMVEVSDAYLKKNPHLVALLEGAKAPEKAPAKVAEKSPEPKPEKSPVEKPRNKPTATGAGRPRKKSGRKAKRKV